MPRTNGASGDSPATPPPTATSTPQTRMARKISALTAFWSGNTTGLPVISPCSLANATRLPDRVTAPISIEIPMVTPPNRSSDSAAAWLMRTNSAPATTAEAPPPEPLKMPTI